MGIFRSGSSEAIADASKMDRAETADALRRQAGDQLALGNQNTAGRLLRQAIALEDDLD